MAEPKPKLGILRDAGIPSGEIETLLGDRFEVWFVDGPEAGDVAFARRLLESLPVAAALIDAAGATVWANPAFLLLDPGLRRQVESRAATHLREGEPASAERSATSDAAEEEIEDASGGLFRISVSHARVPSDRTDSPPEPAAAVVVQDVSRDRARRQRVEAIDRAGCDLLRLDTEAMQRLAPLERLDLLRTRIVRAMHDLFRFNHFAIRLVDERTGKLELLMSEGLPQMVSELELRRGLTGEGITGYVAATGKSYICEDTRTDPLFLPGLEEARSSLTVPMLLGHALIGVMDIESDEPAAFDDDDRFFAEMFTRYIALAIHLLDLLVVERSTTNQTVSGRVEGELRDPLEDIAHEAEWLNEAATADPETARHIQKIVADVEDIRDRVKRVAAGPKSILGVDKRFTERGPDPALIGKRVLIADDEPGIRRIIHDVLRSRGCEVEVCESGSRAIEAVRTAAGNGQGFDLIVSDIQMPDRNGYEVFSAARDAIPETPVILMTGFGYDPNHSIVRASQEGLQSVLFKPFQVERLLDEVKKALVGEES